MNIPLIRNETRGLDDKLFFNSAGSSLMPSEVLELIRSYLEEEELHGGYKAAEKHHDLIQSFYSHLAKFLNAHIRNFAFAFNATEAYGRALSVFDWQAGDIIITTDDDYASNFLNFISLEKRYGIKTIRIRNMENGDLDIGHFRDLLDRHKARLVAVTHVPTNSGLVQDVETIGEICSEMKIWYLVDACQSVGQIEVDVSRIKCDFLSATGRKFLRGPRGTGFLYVSDRALNEGLHPMMIDGAGANWESEHQFKLIPEAKRFESWEKPYALMIGLSGAIRIANNTGIENIRARNEKLWRYLSSQLNSIENVNQYEKGSHRCSIITFRKSGRSLDETQRTLDNNKLYFSVSRKNWALIDYGKKDIDWTIRLSPHYFNTVAEIDAVAEIIEQL